MPRQLMADRRVLKTRNSLYEALAALVHERSYDSITVKQLLDRANVGRSTFYTHFRDKDELLVSGIHQMLCSALTAPSLVTKRPERIIAFSLPMFVRCDQRRRDAKAKIDTRTQVLLHGHLQAVLAESIGVAVEGAVLRDHERTARLSPEVLARYVAATFIVVLDWWMDSGQALTAKEANDLFRALVLPTLTTALG